MMAEQRVVVFFGLTGSGKSYLAGRWAEDKGYPYFNSDEVRKDLAGVEPESRHHVPFNEGLYSPEMTRRTYREIIDRAAAIIDDLAIGTVVLDGSFGRVEQQQAVIDRFTGRAQVIFVLCSCSESVTRRRFQIRAEDKGAVSDGRWEIYNGQKGNFSIPDRLEEASLCRLDTDHDIDALIDQVDQCIDRIR